MVFAKAVATENIDILYYKIDHNNRKIFYPFLSEVLKPLIARFSFQGFNGFAPKAAGAQS
jgi:hypothetical protein